MAPMITEVTTKVAESFNPLLNSKRRIIAMNPKTMIKEWACKISLSVCLAEDLHRMKGLHAGLTSNLHAARFTI